jgi:futalosine hydrolase
MGGIVSRVTQSRTKTGPILLAVAAPSEARAALAALGADPVLATQEWKAHQAGPFEIVITGVGKACAAGGVARVLRPDHHAGVISVGIAGALPMDGKFAPNGTAIAATASVFADEGVQSPAGFSDIASLGFAPVPGAGVSLESDAGLLALLAPVCDLRAGVATVSICSGTDEQARAIAQRTGAMAEAMEGAGVAVAARRLGVAHAELRVISNRTGDRERQGWDIPGALAKLAHVLGRLATTVRAG